jgi:lysophospholipase L1-like esterase
MDVDAPTPTRRHRFGSTLVTALVIVATAALAVSALVVGPRGNRDASAPGGSAPNASAGASTPPAAPAPDPVPTRLVAVGDSITVAGGDIPAGLFTDLSWVRYAVGPPVVPHGGWAVSGATTTQMAAGFAAPVGEPYVLVILAGTNDVAVGLPFAESKRNLLAIAHRAQDAARVLVTAIPPLSGREADTARYNADLAALATEQGWTYVDPMPAVAADGRWLAGMSFDGIHPTPEGARLIGAGIRTAVLAP